MGKEYTDLKMIKGKLLVKFESEGATVDKVNIGGVELFVDGSYHLEVNAQSIAEVVHSGIEGIEAGMKIGISYHVVFAHDLHGNNTRTYHNCYEIDGQKMWLVKEPAVFCIIDGENYKAWGDHVLLRPKYIPEEGIISDMELTRNGTKVFRERGIFVSGCIDECKEGDEVYFKWNMRGETDFGYKNTFYIMPSRHIQCIMNGRN